MADRTWTVGIDVGGTKIAAGVVSFPDGAIGASRIIPTRPELGGADVLQRCVDLTAELIDAGRSDLAGEPLGIGIGVPELLDVDGNVASSYSVPWEGVPVVETLAALAPVTIEMDQIAAAFAEARFGAGAEHDPFLYVTVGTGLGCTLVQGGVPFRGARNAAGVFGNGPFSTTCPHCGNRYEMILDEIAAGPALARRYGERGGAGDGGAELVVQAAADGDPVATAVVTEGGEALGVSLALLVDIFDPAAVVIGGGLGLAGGLYWDSAVAAMREHIWSEPHRDLPVLPAALGVDAGVIGAGVAAWLAASSAGERSPVDDEGGPVDEAGVG